MKRKHSKRFLLLALSWGAMVNVIYADDYGVWTDLAVQKNLSQQWSVDAGIDLRAENNLNNLTRYGFSAGVNYKPMKCLSFGTGYSFLRDYNLAETKYKYEDGAIKNCKVDEAYWRSKHRVTFDVTGSLPIGRFTLSLRERYQYTHFVATTTRRLTYKNMVTDAELPPGYTGTVYEHDGHKYTKLDVDDARSKAAKDRHYLRSRLGVEYNIKHCAWTPYATYEFSNNLSDGLHLDKQRLTVGAEWKITKQHRLDFAYVYNNGADDDNDADCHVLSIGYKFKF